MGKRWAWRRAPETGYEGRTRSEPYSSGMPMTRENRNLFMESARRNTYFSYLP
jgi:hypothetical protein